MATGSAVRLPCLPSTTGPGSRHLAQLLSRPELHPREARQLRIPSHISQYSGDRFMEELEPEELEQEEGMIGGLSRHVAPRWR